MVIVSEEGYVSGQPRIAGTRIWVSHVVDSLVGMGSVEEYLRNFSHIPREQVKEALDYCRRQECRGKVVSYCQGCTKDKSAPLKSGIQAEESTFEEEKEMDLWEVAERLYKQLC